MKRCILAISLVVVSLLTCIAFAENFDVDQYTWEELIRIQSIVEQKIEEYALQDAIENGDRLIEIAEKDLLIYAGKTQKVDATVTIRHESAPKNTVLVWESDHPEIATVSNGTIKGVTVGEATITVKAKDNEYINSSIHVRIVNSVKTVEINQKEIVLLIGGDESKKEADLHVDITPEDAYNKELTWISSDENIVSVDEKGHLVALSGGKATISVTTNDPSLQAQKTVKCNVSVLESVQNVELNTASLTVHKGKTDKLKANVYPDTATKKDVVWITSNDKVATVSNGTVTGKGPGKCIITCVSSDGSDVSATCEVTVLQAITSIQPGPRQKAKFAMMKGSRINLTTTILPADASVKELKWKSSNSNIVEIEKDSGEYATIYAKKEGTATITASAIDGSKKSLDTVIVVEGPFAIEDCKVGDIGTSWGSKWFVNEYRNTSSSRTIDGLTIRYYGKDIYNNKIKAYGFGDIYHEEVINITIGPGQVKSTPRITAYGLDDAKYIYVAVVKVHYTDGTTAEAEEPHYYYWTY